MESDIFPDELDDGNAPPRGEVWLTAWAFMVVGSMVGLVLLFTHSTHFSEIGLDEKTVDVVKNEIDRPLLTYRTHTGDYPTTAQGLRALIAAPSGVAGWQGPYLNMPDVPLDPWKHPYQYAYAGMHNGTRKPDIWSLGPDGKSGTEDDIGNW